MADIDYAEMVITAHGEPFNRKGWEYILKKHNGYLPIRIKAFKEGMIIPSKVPMITVESTDEQVPWIAGYIETILLKVWYPITVATISYTIKKQMLKYAEKTSDNPDDIIFKLHDFGARGVSSEESAGIGGMAHLMNFRGTDTMSALVYARMYYNASIAGFSIPAAEHSTIISWGKENEAKAYENMLNKFLKKNTLVAVVSDSYDLYNAIENIWGKKLKKHIESSEGMVILRPDSGEPLEVVMKSLELLEKSFGCTINSKGYKVLNNVRIIQGDGINTELILSILELISKKKYSIDNISFGMGGELLQKINRDTYSFAMKASSVNIGNEEREIYKAPLTDKSKKSKKGKITTIKKDDTYKCILIKDMPNYLIDGWNEELEIVFENGKLFKNYKFEEIRN